VNREEFIRIRTDALVSFHNNPDFSPAIYHKAYAEYYGDSQDIEKEDQAMMALMPMMNAPQYSMKDLDKPSILSNLEMPNGYEDFVDMFPTKKNRTTIDDDYDY